MSRVCTVIVSVKGITEDKVREKLEKELDFDSLFTFDEFETEDEIVRGEATVNLSGGASEEEGHNEIVKDLQEINPLARVKTKWYYEIDFGSFE
jgi:hypothetical protein